MLYHLSEENHNGEIFKSRVPYSIAFDDEDRIHLEFASRLQYLELLEQLRID